MVERKLDDGESPEAGDEFSCGEAEGVKVGVVFSDDQGILKLNRRFRGEDSPTDVLAFPVHDQVEEGLYCLGEVIVNLERACIQAKDYGVEEREEIARLILHGVLHLLGYRDGGAASRKEMEKVQEGILDQFKRGSYGDSPAE